MRPAAEDFEDARRRNVNADELGMLPVPYDPAKLGPRIGVELKIDGIGILDVNSHLQSLEGASFDCALHLARELGALRAAFGTPMVLHGEFFERGGFNATLGAFRSGKSKGGVIILWDALTLKAWHGHEQSPPLWQRRAQLEAAFATVRPGMIGLSKLVEAVPADAPMIELALQTAIDGGHEGLVVKDLDSPYRRGRSSWWMKVKPVETIDVPIQAVRADEDGRVKSVVVTVAGKPAVIGSGFSETLRCCPEEFEAGRMVEIKCVGRTEAGQLRDASFVRFRDDKMKGGRA